MGHDEVEERGRGGGNAAGALFVGMLIGLAIGFLFAPRAGAETREQIKTRAQQMKARTDEFVGRVKEAAGRMKEEAEETARSSGAQL